MLLLRWLWIGNGYDGEIPPIAVFWALRVLMFIISFVLEDWAIHELIQSPRHRRVAFLLVASSYVTWTYQTHTFSNSIETLVVAWCLVLVERIVETPVRLRHHHFEYWPRLLTSRQHKSSLLACTVLGFVAVFGLFNRITFPGFLLVPAIRLVPHFWARCVCPTSQKFSPMGIAATNQDADASSRPLALATTLVSASITAALAITLDTAFYTPHSISWSDLVSNPVITPLNNIKYNVQPENLARHGLHPWYQHFLFNLPQLVGPAIILLFSRPQPSLRLFSAISGIFILSMFEHQEARFLLPSVPLILSSIRLPRHHMALRLWVLAWAIFNLFFGALMGVYHQGGVVPAQVFMSSQPDATNAVWWKTYSPPVWLLNGKNEVLQTHDVMGMHGDVLMEKLTHLATCDTPADRRNSEYLKEKNGTYLVVPSSTTWLDRYLPNKGLDGLRFREVWRHRRHLNLDDLDFREDGLWNTLSRVVGRRGLVAYRVTKSCPHVKRWY